MSIDYQNFKKDKKPKKEYGYAPGGDLPKEVSNLMQYTDTADNKYFVYRTYDGAIQFYIVRKEAMKQRMVKRDLLHTHSILKKTNGVRIPGKRIDVYTMKISSKRTLISQS